MMLIGTLRKKLVIIFQKNKESKMIKKILIFGILSLIYMVPIFQSGQIKAAEDEKEKFLRMPMGEAYNLSDTEFKVLQAKGLQGDPEAALRLSLYYDLCKRDYKEGHFWKMIAAENGHPTGQYNYGFDLSQDSDPRNRQRAKFWLKHAAAKGVKEAQSLLKELEK